MAVFGPLWRKVAIVSTLGLFVYNLVMKLIFAQVGRVVFGCGGGVIVAQTA